MRKVCLFRKAINAALLITCLKFITAQFPLLIRMVSCKYLSSVIFTQPTPSPQSFFEHSSSILSSSMSLISVTPGSSSSLIHSQQPKHRDTCVRDDIKSRRGRSSWYDIYLWDTRVSSSMLQHFWVILLRYNSLNLYSI